MDQKPDHKAPRPSHRTNLNPNNKIAFTELDSEDFKRTANLHVSPKSQSPPQKASRAAKGRNCLCSPTTHIGSFRCRHHRLSNGMLRGGSVGSNLSDLGRKSTEIIRSPYSP